MIGKLPSFLNQVSHTSSWFSHHSLKAKADVCGLATLRQKCPARPSLHFWVFNILILTLLYRFSFLLTPGVSEKPSSSERLSRKEGRILLPTSCPLSRLERRRRTTSWSVGGNRLKKRKCASCTKVVPRTQGVLPLSHVS